MPIALLLQKPFARLPTPLASAKALMPWIDIVRAEMPVLARVRGAFMVRWFGRSIPFSGAHIRITVDNRADLDARLAEAITAGQTMTGAASATTPVAALAGMVGGIWLSPMGQVAQLIRLVELGKIGVAIVAVGLGGLLWGGVLVAPGAALIVGGVVGGAALAAGAGAFAVFRSHIDGILMTAASAVRAINAATVLLRQLLAPRSTIRNPLWRAVLELGDQLGALAAQMLGAFAFVIDYVGPRLVSTARSLAAIRRTITISTDALTAIAESFVAELQRLAPGGDLSVLPLMNRFTATVFEILAVASKMIGLGIDLASNTIVNGKEKLTAAVSGYLDDIKNWTVWDEHPTIKTINALTAVIEQRGKNAPKPSPQNPGSQAGGLLETLGAPPKLELPDFDKILKEQTAEPLPPLSWEAIQKAAASPQALDPDSAKLARQAKSALAGMPQRPTVFEDQRKGMREALAENRGDLNELATKMSVLMGDYLTPGLWKRFAPQVEQGVDAFVTLVYGDVEAAERPSLPVLRADKPVPIRPVIRRLRLRTPGATESEGNALRDDVLRRLRQQSYALTTAG